MTRYLLAWAAMSAASAVGFMLLGVCDARTAAALAVTSFVGGALGYRDGRRDGREARG